MAVGLLERDAALSSIEALVRRAATGAGGVIVVEASAGMGKTAVLDEVRSRAGQTRVLVARGVDLEREFALGVARQLLEPALRRADAHTRERWLTGAGLAEAVLRGDAGSVEEGTAFNALYWVLAAMTADDPILLIVDDVHWCDRESLAWIGFVARRLEGLRLTVLLAARPPEQEVPDRAFATLRADPRVRTIALEPLTPDATALILRRELGAADDEFVAACHGASAGNPFLLRELLSAAREQRLAPSAPNAERVASLTSAGLQRAVTARLIALGEGALTVARSVALLGADAPLSLVAAFARMPLEEVARAAQALQRADLLAPGRRLGFRHPLLRSAVVAELGEIAVRAEHARAARVLHEGGASAEAVAAHLLVCEPVGEPWAAEALERAVRDAFARASPRLAGRLLERALLEPVDEHRRASLMAELGGALATAGDPRGIDSMLFAAQCMEDPVRCCDVVVRLAIPMWSCGRIGELPAVLEAARAALRDDHPELTFQLAAARAQAAAWGSGERVNETVSAALALVPPPGSDGLRTRLALALLATAALNANRPRDEVALLARRARGDSAAHARAIAGGVPLMPAVAALHHVEDEPADFDAFARIEAGQRARGALAIGLSTTLSWRAICRVRTGALLEGQADAEVALATAPAQSFPHLRTPATTALARVHLERGFPERSLALIDAQLACGGRRGTEQAILALERARVLQTLRRPREAADTALAIGAEARALGYESASLLLWPTVAAEALLELGDADQAARLAARGVELAERFGAPGPIGCAMRVLGLAERRLQTLRRAERMLAGSVMRLEHGRALVELGAALRRDGQRGAAREPLAAGMELAHRCAANALVARAHEELRAAGARPRSVVRSGVEALTASELRTARLAADGLTNREIAQHLFVTQKTIETQLRATYRKLDIAGRGNLQTALAD